MARPRRAGATTRRRSSRKASTGFVAWSDIYYGGETQDTVRPNGIVQKVIVSRNIVHRGEPVSQDQLGVTDEEWEHLIESGSVRDYEIPEGSSDAVSPTRAFMSSIVDENGDIDPNKLMAMASQNPVAPAPVMNPPASEGATLETKDDETPKGA